MVLGDGVAEGAMPSENRLEIRSAAVHAVTEECCRCGCVRLACWCLGGLRGASAPARGPVADLLNGRDWAHFAGGKPTHAGVRVTHLDRRITRQDGTGGQPNPPVNLRGPHMVFRGDVRIEASLRRTDDTDAYLHLYGETPVIYDEWRYERRGVRIGVVGGRLRIDRWDGDSDRPAVTRTLGGGLGHEVRLALEVRGSRLVVETDGRVVGTVPARDVFGRGRIWFGADAGARGKGWTLSDLHAQSLGRGRMSVVDAPGLRVPRSTDAMRDLAAGLPARSIWEPPWPQAPC